MPAVPPRPLRRRSSPWRAPRGAAPLPRPAQKLLELMQRSIGVIWTREDLRVSLGLSDRAMRQAAETLRHHGYPVLSTAEGEGGYWYARTAAEIEEFRSRALFSRIVTLSAESKALLRTQRQYHDLESQSANAPALQRALAIA